ncbi:MAG: DUF167 family protein [Desulfocapsaceae bacterium]|nr:DUF167 family protein [Desulfocapsaceae bacterium]
MNHVVTVKGRTAIRIVVQPSAQKTKFIGLHDGMLKLAVAAPPVDGRANKEIITYLAKFFDVKKSQVHIFSGERSRKKLCSLANLKESEVRNKLIDFGG